MPEPDTLFCHSPLAIFSTQVREKAKSRVNPIGDVQNHLGLSAGRFAFNADGLAELGLRDMNPWLTSVKYVVSERNPNLRNEGNPTFLVSL